MRTTVDHALIRGLVTAGPVMRRGASSVWDPASDRIRLLVETRVLLAVTVPPALPNFGCVVVGGLLFAIPRLQLRRPTRFRVASVSRSPKRSPKARAQSRR